jgi:hypothetical protein
MRIAIRVENFHKLSVLRLLYSIICEKRDLASRFFAHEWRRLARRQARVDALRSRIKLCMNFFSVLKNLY